MAPNPAAHSDLVPGTIRLVDIEGEARYEQHAQGPKDIVLIPRPSADLEDPLNWSRKRKLIQITMVYVYTLGVGIPTTLQYSVLADITRDTAITTGELVTGTGLVCSGSQLPSLMAAGVFISYLACSVYLLWFGQHTRKLQANGTPIGYCWELSLRQSSLCHRYLFLISFSPTSVVIG